MRILPFALAALLPLGAATLSVDDLVAHAMTHDGSLAADAQLLHQYTLQKEAIRRWDNPELALSYSRTKPDAMNNQNEYGIALLQPIDKPSLRRAKQAVVDAKIVQLASAVADKKMKLRGEILQKAYLEAVAQRMAAKADEAAALAATIRAKGERQVAEGALAKADLMKLQVEEGKVAAEQTMARLKAQSAHMALSQAARMTEPFELTAPDIERFLAVPVVPPASDTLPIAAYYRALAAEADAERHVAEASVIPGVRVGLGYQNLYDQRTVTGTLAIPLPVMTRNEPQIAAAQSRIDEARMRLEAYVYEATRTIAAQSAARDRLVSLAADQAAISRQAEAMRQLAQKSYEQGYSSLLELIDARRVALSAQKEYLATLEAAVVAQSELIKYIFIPQESR